MMAFCNLSGYSLPCTGVTFGFPSPSPHCAHDVYLLWHVRASHDYISPRIGMGWANVGPAPGIFRFGLNKPNRNLADLFGREEDGRVAMGRTAIEELVWDPLWESSTGANRAETSPLPSPSKPSPPLC